VTKKKALFRGRDYITTQEWTDAEIEVLLDVSSDLKRKFKRGVPHRYLADQTIFLMFFDKSTRTRNSFEAGMTQLGGHAHFLTADVMQVSHGESPKDTGIILSSYGHGIAIRHDLIPGEGNSYMREVAKWASAPVINMQCDVDHPCQTLADLMTIREKLGRDLRGKKIAVTWAYAPSYAKPLSVPQGLIMLMPRFGLDVTLAHPKEYFLMPETMKAARENAKKAGVKFEVVDNMEDAFRDADIVIPKSWGCLDTMGQNPQESLRIATQYKHWICDERRMKLTKKNSLYMHPLPADRGNEVTDDVIDGPRSVVFDEAENRLHTCKAIMALTMSKKPVPYEVEASAKSKSATKKKAKARRAGA
jgi:ornithine carbamoyltransferase